MFNSLVKLDKHDYCNLSLLVLYSFAFLIIRLLASKIGMNPDEAEQFIDAADYHWGYSDQPPLYSWILKTCSLAFGMSVVMQVCAYHVIIVLFLAALYIATRELWQREQAYLVFLSNALFFIYSYDFFRYTIHSTLMMIFVSLALWAYLRLFKETKIFYYLVLGFSFACGLLSKYNFALFLVVLVLGSLASQRGRKILFNPGSAIAILLMFLLLSGHIFWLISNDFPSFNYALERGHSGLENSLSFEVFIHAFWNYALYLIIILLFFRKDLLQNGSSSIADQDLSKSIRVFALLAFLLPLILMLVLQTNNFSQRWLAPINIFFPLAAFSYIAFNFKLPQYRRFKIAILVVLIACFTVRIAVYYFPDLMGINFVQKPYREVFSNLDKDLAYSPQAISFDNAKFFSYKEVTLFAGFKIVFPKADLELFRHKADLNTCTADEEPCLILWDDARNKDFERLMQKSKIRYRLLFTKSAPHLYAKQRPFYRVNFALIDHPMKNENL